MLTISIGLTIIQQVHAQTEEERNELSASINADLEQMMTENGVMLKRSGAVFTECGNQLEAGDMHNLPICMAYMNTFNKLMKTFENSTKADAMTIMGFNQGTPK